MGGPEELPCNGALKAVWQYFKSDKSAPFLNVVFHFPGSLITPLFTGLRTGKFSTKEQGFMIQVSVPEEIAKSTKDQTAVIFFLDSIEQALVMSKKRWEKHGIIFPYEKDQEIIRQVRIKINAK